MSRFKEYENYDALGLADLVKKKQVTPQELLSEAIYRTEEVDPILNAVVMKHYDEARRQIKAGLPEGLFKGVPFLLKNLVLLKNTITTFGSQAFEKFEADHNSHVVDKYIQSGLVIFGKTNSPELGLAPTTEPRLHGATKNPWDLTRTPGGSSGGAAAAVTARIVPAAHASDGGGSIRIPASACGVFGLKPTRGRVSSGPDRGEGWGSLAISHVISRTVRDSAALLDVAQGLALGDPYTAPEPKRPFLMETEVDVGRLRIAFNSKRPDGSQSHPDVIEAIEVAARLLSNLGHEVFEGAPTFDVEEMSHHQMVLIASNTALLLKQYGALIGREPTSDDFENMTLLIAGLAKQFSSLDYADAMNTIHRMGRDMAHFHTNIDIYVSPTLALPPVKTGELDMMTENPLRYAEVMKQFLPNIGIYNMTGQPSMSVPLHWNNEGLPIGVMMTARFGDEATLFRLATQLEKAKPWKDKKPKVS